jgi:beta-N-acetylhexosaminidase
MKKEVNLTASPFFLTKKEAEETEEQIAKLKPEQIAGQFFLVLADQFKEQELLTLASQGRISGVLFRPVLSKEELKKKLADLDRVSLFPLIKAANMEQGANGAFKDGTCYGSEMAVGATGQAIYARRLGAIAAYEAREAGINASFSPVCDLALNPLNPIIGERSFSSRPYLVSRLAAAAVRGLEENGVAAVIKHFPGDGVDYRDQHLHPTYNSLGYKEYMASYGSIYKDVLLSSPLGVMAGHILCPSVEENIDRSSRFEDCLPASLSSNLLQGFLRQRLGFNGLIFSDATIMGGYTQAMDRKEALLKSINAGIDIIVFNTDYKQDYETILDGLKEGKISEERQREALLRIFAFKKAASKLNKTTVLPSDIADWADECAEKSMTLVKSNAPLLPLNIKKYPKIKLAFVGKEEGSDGNIKLILKSELEKAGFKVSLFEMDQEDLHDPSEEEQDSITLIAANLPAESNNVTNRVRWVPKHALDSPRFIHEHRYIFVSFSNPFCLQDVPRITTCFNAYTPSAAACRAFVKTITGLSVPYAKSPVDAFCGLKDTKL